MPDHKGEAQWASRSEASSVWATLAPQRGMRADTASLHPTEGAGPPSDQVQQAWPSDASTLSQQIKAASEGFDQKVGLKKSKLS